MGGRGGRYFRLRLPDGSSIYVVRDSARGEPETTAPERTTPERTTYHYFHDKADDGWNYEGDGHHQIQWFKEHSNVDDIISKMSRSEIRAFEEWAKGFFMHGQQYGGWDRMSANEKEVTQRMDTILDQATLDRGVIVTRRATAELVMGAGTTHTTLEGLRSMEGSYVTSKGAMSTGAAAEGLTISFDGSKKQVEYRFHIPGGTKGAGMWIGDRRINPGWGADQREFVVNRDTTFRVGTTRHDSTRDVYVVDMYYEGRQEHDYGTSGKIL